MGSKAKRRAINYTLDTLTKISCLIVISVAICLIFHLCVQKPINEIREASLPSVLSTVKSYSHNHKDGESRRIAVVISITEEVHPKYGIDYIDITSALAQSVWDWNVSSIHHIDLIAFVRPQFNECILKLEAFGFKIMRKEIPISIKEIKPGKYRNQVDHSGCCGISELMKLHAYTLTEYYRVIHVDTDVFFNQGIDELVNVPSSISLMYTNSTLQAERLSGGFLMVKPSLHIFEELLSIVRSGDFRYKGLGWAGSGIGYSWGGETIQGLLPYFYEKRFTANVDGSPSSVRLDRCVYNIQGGNDCLNADPNLIKMAHLTVCQKPFTCRTMKHIPLCFWMHNKWWELSSQLQVRLGLRPTIRCTASGKESSTNPRHFQPINISRSSSA